MDNDDFCDKLKDLLIRSEGRINQTNEMVHQCISVMEKSTTEYTLQITKLQEARDKLIEENASLIRMTEKANQQTLLINQKYDNLLEKLLSYIPSGNASENNINIH